MARRPDPTLHFLLIGLLLATALALALRTAAGAPFVWAALVGINVAAFALYGYDKWRARQGGFRVPENALHALALLGGSVGALAAQRMFRHKTSKRSFQILFWLICVAQIGVLAWWLMRR